MFMFQRPADNTLNITEGELKFTLDGFKVKASLCPQEGKENKFQVEIQSLQDPKEPTGKYVFTPHGAKTLLRVLSALEFMYLPASQDPHQDVRALSEFLGVPPDLLKKRQAEMMRRAVMGEDGPFQEPPRPNSA